MNGLIVDLFAGGGGASTGLAWALGRDPDIAIEACFAGLQAQPQPMELACTT